MHFQDRIEITCNVHLRLRDQRGRVVDERVGHNVFTNKGRNWLSRYIASASFNTALNPAPDGPNTNLTGDSGQTGNIDPFSPVGGTYRPRYVGVGVGGSLQSISPPGAGGQVEEASVLKIERMAQVNPGPPVQWFKQLLVNDNPNDPVQFPDDYTTRYRAIFGYDDISFATCVDELGVLYGTDVPVTEIGLFTSQAALTTLPTAASGPWPIAYHQFRPLSVTPSFVLEVDWDFHT